MAQDTINGKSTSRSLLHFSRLAFDHVLAAFPRVLLLRISYVATLFYAPMAFFVKVALLAILARIFAPSRKVVIVVYAILAIVMGYYLPAFIIKVRICMPISAYWEGTEHGGSCLNQGAVITADSVMSVVTDLAILILPLPLTWSLHMSMERKLKIIDLLSAGGLATGFSLYRLVMIVKDGDSPDQTIVFTRVVLTGNAEGGVGLICACLPALNVLVSRVGHSGPSSKKRSHGSGYQLSKVRNVDETWNEPGAVGNQPNHPDFCSDQSGLISNAQGFPNSLSAQGGSSSSLRGLEETDGIRKTVAMSQSVEIVGNRKNYHTEPKLGKNLILRATSLRRV
ncbi:hypothetical protein T310_2712 [Rasamsonia emersonii CBS 393.64]|uniref:Rhodopsin domain-containing protein n=1 Tax=Rasamsonia emersonii (strain ATCC 16479 / CBS 393.64 / IMI 116815) TaxID=1408163 RepID=A0A0F4YYB4_RASE3|nr:hypothetical protein T310_2712 [Rasamsonia emersonii CBS 393.64]KKA23219.1 hypothetical protein T310_2712 [Rasamsonia emersonii CBS 393.64]